jgi:hypothetical protein
MQINWNIEKNYLTLLCVFKFNGYHKKGEGVVWGPRAKICHGPRATLIGPGHLSVVLVVLMPIAKDQKRALMTPPVGELLAQPKPAQWNMGAQGQLYPWGPGEPQLSPPSVDKLFIPFQICICRPPLSWDRGENCSLPPSPCMGGPGAALVLS